MSGASVNRSIVLSLYKKLMREGSKFTAYNYRNYALRRTRDAFRENKNLSDNSLIKTCVNSAMDNLEIVKRQVIIGKLYTADKLIIEK